MIGSLKGKIIKKGSDWALIDTNGVGYKVFVLPETLASTSNKEEEIILFTHLYVREDILSLYGFKTLEELEFFELLISVSGIGPKAALGVLSIGNVSSLRKAIAEGRSDLLMGVSGVGKKTADRVILELSNKVEGSGTSSLPQSFTKEDEEIIQALVNLGYKKQEASEAVIKLPPDLEGAEKIKQALRFLGK